MRFCAEPRKSKIVLELITERIPTRQISSAEGDKKQDAGDNCRISTALKLKEVHQFGIALTQDLLNWGYIWTLNPKP